ncbi:MAG: galactitol-1-phosphate 5-dehydrogenase [Clostridia bacterium]|nr:galactitol-1-phosphate 5-dehydrogenase [Clostridia bacterium]
MKAVRILEPEIIEYSDVPKPQINDSEALIRVKAVGICGSDLELLSGDMPHIKNGFTTYPLIPGHEWAGQIEEIGKGVQGFSVGDRVTGDVSLGCGNCHMCKIGRYNLCPNRVVVGSYRNKDGAFAEYIKMPYKNLYKLSENISYEEAALTEPAATAAYGIMRAKIGFGDTVLVIGDGPIGQLAMQCAKISGASKVIAVGSWDKKLEIARQLAADVVVNYKKDDVVEKVLENTDYEGADVILETSGNMIAFNQSIKAVKPGGKIVLYSFYNSVEFPVSINNFIVKDADLIGILASPNASKPVLSLMESGRINVKPLITHRYPMEKISEAIAMIKEKKECRIKVLLTP